MMRRPYGMFYEPTKSMSITMPQAVLDRWTDWCNGRFRAVMAAATIYRWLTLTPDQRREAVLRLVDQGQWLRTAKKVKTSFTIPVALLDELPGCLHDDYEGEIPPAARTLWRVAMFDDAIHDQGIGRYCTNGAPAITLGGRLLDDFHLWESRHDWIEAMEAAGCDMAEHNTFHPAPIEPSAKKRKGHKMGWELRKRAENPKPTDPADWWLPPEQRGKKPDDDDRGDDWKR